MALIKYKVLQSDCKDGEAHIPEKATPIGMNSDFVGGLFVVFVMKYTDWVEEFPKDAEEEKKKERKSRKGVNNAE